jgi:hypothetical protein
MSKAQLLKINQFKIWNQHGSVEFEGDIDLTGCDLAKDIVISTDGIDLYP